jgi:uncharacterized LabA/DUF88 family protein
MRIAVFIDYWNFQLTLNSSLAKKLRIPGYRAKVAWKQLGPELTAAACTTVGCDPTTASYEGCYIYTSFNPATDDGRKFRNWATTWLDRQPGVNVQIRERRPKALPRCPTCHQEISHCPHADCGQPIIATVEKGIDTLLVTDLIRLGHSNTYDVAVLATSDADMVPAVQFIQTTGKKVIQAGFPPSGVDLATECWGSFNVLDIQAKIQRPNGP